MANGPPFATLNHVAADLGIPNESEPLRVGIMGGNSSLTEREICEKKPDQKPTCGIKQGSRQPSRPAYIHSQSIKSLFSRPNITPPQLLPTYSY
jgi:hypothetical protein